MAPDKSGGFFAVLRETIISGNAGIAAFERAHLKTDEARDHAILLPFFVGLDLEVFLARVVVFPKLKGSLRNLGGMGVRREAVLL